VRRGMLIAIAALLTGSLGVPAAAEDVGTGSRPWRDDYVSLRGADGPGPAWTDRVHVLRVGAPDARRVLVLVPGQFGAAGDFHSVARELARRLPDTQVWAVDRRETNLEDPAGFLAGDPDRAADYYLGGHYRSATAQSAPYAAGWGLTATMNDLRRVVLAARDGGHRQVVLGGHSWGATTALAYAGWDFHGRAGYRDLAGLVLIDGGVHDAFAGEGDVYRVTPEQAQQQLDNIASGTVFDPSVTMGRTETSAIVQQLAGMYAKAAPDAPSTLAPHLPALLRPSGPVTNAGLLSWLYVAHPLVADLSVNPAYTSLAALAAMFAGPVPGPFEWYWPQRLTLDLSAADPFIRTATTDLLGLRVWHSREIDVPLYSFESGLTHGTVNEAARWVVGQSRIASATYAGDDRMTHIDVLSAEPDHNPMFDSLVPFLSNLNER
jgi:pimeloyl-ACP methyl ester carboxylesterase